MSKIKNLEIKDWLIKEKYIVKDITDMKKDKYRLHAISQSINFEVVQPLNQNYFVIVFLLPVYEIFGEQMNSLSFQERNSLFISLRSDLLRIPGIYFNILWKNEKDCLFDNIQLTSDLLFFQDLNRTLFFKTVGFLRKIFVYIIEIIKNISNLDIPTGNNDNTINSIHYS